MKKHRVKCRYCGRGFNVPVGTFPKALFKHIGSKHKEAAKRRAAARKASKPTGAPRTRKRAVMSQPPAGVYQSGGGVWHPPGCRCDGCK